MAGRGGGVEETLGERGPGEAEVSRAGQGEEAGREGRSLAPLTGGSFVSGASVGFAGGTSS